MPIKAQGATGTPNPELHVRNSTGDFVDPSNLSLTIENATTGLPIAGFPVSYPGTIVKDAVGRYHYDWDVPADLPITTYHAIWESILLGAPETAQETWEIVAPGSMSTSGFDFLLHPDDYDAIRGLLGVTTLDVEDTDIELVPFGPLAEREIKRRISNWATQMLDSDQLFVLRMATIYRTACEMARSFVRGGTIGLVRPLGTGEGRDWAAAADQFCSGYEYWVNIADQLDTEGSDGSDFTVDPLLVGGPTSHRIAHRHGVREVTDPATASWWTYPPLWR